MSKEELLRKIDDYLKEMTPRKKRNEFEKGVAFGLRLAKVMLGEKV
jgi:hypothetical protein